MNQLLYNASLALLTDLYQLTMAYGYWKLGRAEQRAVFHLFFRSPPFSGGYTLAAGLQPALDFLSEFRFDKSDIEFLATLRGNDGGPLFPDQKFLDYLAELQLTCDVHAMPEGSLCFGREPLLRVTGPILQCQLLETALLNIVNFQTLIATKAARICSAARGEPVIEFGLRRAQGIDGGLAASRAAYIGGCAATSNVLAGKLYGVPVKGTHAHSWVMSFDTEPEAFEQYAAALPNNCVFLVDTYDTLDGVRNAIEVGQRLRARGHEMVGIRLDSGDLAYLSIEARKLLDAAGFPKAAILASNDLDEKIIESLKQQGAKIAVWGVGTKLVTAYDQPALGGVYKLGALQNADDSWSPKVKLSEQVVKTSIPGILQVKRFENDGEYIGDLIYDELLGSDSQQTIIDPKDPLRKKKIDAAAVARDVLIPVLKAGQRVVEAESLTTIRERVQSELGKLNAGSKRFLNPHEYPVGLDAHLQAQREKMIRGARER
ncbi:nicotinate phosphoribosyltransferase [Anatilimnocola floriformis]|uniref:nicotinate phosphoribosyltransferase n=1 Tax=Anatilimnocola floriformis TaxID=2948575 RepID=UPI0020C22903|nr:nicotinate phosphoribosyltransferase [Anatilimnocola floriformis]